LLIIIGFSLIFLCCWTRLLLFRFIFLLHFYSILTPTPSSQFLLIIKFSSWTRQVEFPSSLFYQLYLGILFHRPFILDSDLIVLDLESCGSSIPSLKRSLPLTPDLLLDRHPPQQQYWRYRVFDDHNQKCIWCAMCLWRENPRLRPKRAWTFSSAFSSNV